MYFECTLKGFLHYVNDKHIVKLINSWLNTYNNICVYFYIRKFNIIAICGFQNFEFRIKVILLLVKVYLQSIFPKSLLFLTIMNNTQSLKRRRHLLCRTGSVFSNALSISTSDTECSKLHLSCIFCS